MPNSERSAQKRKTEHYKICMITILKTWNILEFFIFIFAVLEHPVLVEVPSSLCIMLILIENEHNDKFCAADDPLIVLTALYSIWKMRSELLVFTSLQLKIVIRSSHDLLYVPEFAFFYYLKSMLKHNQWSDYP